MSSKKKPLKIEVEFTEGYEERFTLAILKIIEKRQKNQGMAKGA